MSWNPFNKRTPPRKSISKAEDGEFDQRVQAVSQMEQNLKKLRKDTKKFVESSCGLSKAEQRMMAELVNGARQVKGGEDLADYAEKLNEVARKCSESQSERDAIIRSTLMQPLKRLDEKFPVIHSAVKRKEQSQQDYMKYLGRKEKFSRDPSSSQSGKYDANEKYLARTKSDLERRNKQLQEDIPSFLLGSVNYFDPCFKAMMQSELNHNQNMKNLHDNLAQESGAQEDLTDQSIEYLDVNKMLEEIKALSIVKAT